MLAGKLLPHVDLSRQEKRDIFKLGLMQVRGATLRIDTPLGFFAGVLVAAHRHGIHPMVGDSVRFGRTEDFDVPYPPGWMLLVEPRISPHNARECTWTESWAVERVDHVSGLLRVLDPTARPGSGDKE